MAILKQAKKAKRRDDRRSVYNLRRKRSMKDVVKDIRDLTFSGKVKEAQEMLPKAYKAIDKAAQRGVIKKNTAARKKSRLSMLVKKNSTKKARSKSS